MPCKGEVVSNAQHRVILSFALRAWSKERRDGCQGIKVFVRQTSARVCICVYTQFIIQYVYIMYIILRPKKKKRTENENERMGLIRIPFNGYFMEEHAWRKIYEREGVE